VIDTAGNKVFIDDLLAVEHRRADVIALSTPARHGIERQILLDCGIHLHFNGLTGGRIVDVTVTGGGRRHEVQVSDALRLANTFVVGKEERTILDDRAADGAAKLVPLEGRLRSSGVLKEIPRVERTVPEELVHAPVKSIGPRARNGVDDSSGCFAILRRIVARENGELLNGVHAEISAKYAAGRSVGVIVEANAVQSIIVLLRPRAGDSQLLSEAAVAAIRARREGWLRLNCLNTGL